MKTVKKAVLLATTVFALFLIVLVATTAVVVTRIDHNIENSRGGESSHSSVIDNTQK